ncbi:MAG TPA: 4Fe-4S binding protein [Bdellovibrionota bacterium]|nr:4Fe-4S binding protein [Bdellovibrionota bacterium]
MIAHALRTRLGQVQLRRMVQLFVLVTVLYLGFDFWRFVTQFETGGVDRGLEHPAGVGAFLPIGGFTTLKHWLVSGTIHPFHPASMILFLAAISVSLVFKKSFCGWICPVGFISELAYLPWKKRFGKNLKLSRFLDYGLRSIKYLLLAFFVWIIGIAMPPEQVAAFLEGDYWKVSDVKMLYFFTKISLTSIVVIGVLALLSIPTRNFWCRFLCPYGALLGIVGLLSPYKIRRDEALCRSCHKCTRNCPAHLPVSTSRTIRSAECTSCLTCKIGCPTGALTYSPRFKKTRTGMTPRALAASIAAVFISFILAAKLGGFWNSGVPRSELARLIPQTGNLEHPR